VTTKPDHVEAEMRPLALVAIFEVLVDAAAPQIGGQVALRPSTGLRTSEIVEL